MLNQGKWGIVKCPIFLFFNLAGSCGFISYCNIKQLNRRIMARPIRETPILFGEDARRFEERMKVKRREDPEKRKRRLEVYNALIKTLKT